MPFHKVTSPLRLLLAAIVLSVLPAQAQNDISSAFVSEEISDSLFARMQGRSYPAGCTVPGSFPLSSTSRTASVR